MNQRLKGFLAAALFVAIGLFFWPLGAAMWAHEWGTTGVLVFTAIWAVAVAAVSGLVVVMAWSA